MRERVKGGCVPLTRKLYNEFFQEKNIYIRGNNINLTLSKKQNICSRQFLKHLGRNMEKSHTNKSIVIQ